MYAPLKYIDSRSGQMLEREASLRDDLESLYLVAVCCCQGEVPWASSHGPYRVRDCARATGLGGKTRFAGFEGEWNFLNRVLQVLANDGSACDLLDAFRCAAGGVCEK